MDNEFLKDAGYAAKILKMERQEVRRHGNYVVVMRDPLTGEEKELTMPGPLKGAKNSCRRFKDIGIENIFVEEQKKKRRKRKKK